MIRREEQIGPCRLLLGDSRAALRSLDDESIDMVWTDPPYGHNNLDGDLQSARVRDGVKGARTKDIEPIANDGPDEMRRVVDDVLAESVRVLKADCCCCCCCCGGGGPKPTFAWTADRMDKRGLSFFHAVVWDKSGRGNGMGWRYRRNYEFVMVAHRKNGRLSWSDSSLAVPNIVKRTPVLDRIHPNEKPLELVRDFIEWHTRPEDTILDPFMGSGTTGVACIKTGRQFVGIEIEERYYDIAVRRCREAWGIGSLFEEPKIEQPQLFADL